MDIKTMKMLAFMRDAANNHLLSEVGKALYECESAAKNLARMGENHPNANGPRAWIGMHRQRISELEESHAEVMAWLKEQGLP